MKAESPDDEYGLGVPNQTGELGRRILAIDLGNFKSVACTYLESGEASFVTVPTTPAVMHDLFVRVAPDRIVIEVCGIAGWMHDLAQSLELEIEVVDTRHEAWRWSKVKRKTDRDDALELARLSAMHQVSTVYMHARPVRQWKSAIAYRYTLVDRRTAIKNTIHTLVDVQGLRMPAGAKAWTAAGRAQLTARAEPMASCAPTELWRGQLDLELRALDQVNALLSDLEAKLVQLASAHADVARLKSIPGVGTRLAELIVATLDRADRFRTGREVGAYVGMVPRQFESGTMRRTGRITKQGPGLLRRVLVQVAWGMERRCPRARELFERLSSGQGSRRRKAAVAVARKVPTWCWALLRDGTTWREPEAIVT